MKHKYICFETQIYLFSNANIFLWNTTNILVQDWKYISSELLMTCCSKLQSLFGQCPNRACAFLFGASQTEWHLAFSMWCGAYLILSGNQLPASNTNTRPQIRTEWHLSVDMWGSVVPDLIQSKLYSLDFELWSNAIHNRTPPPTQRKLVWSDIWHGSNKRSPIDFDIWHRKVDRGE